MSLHVYFTDPPVCFSELLTVTSCQEKHRFDNRTVITPTTFIQDVVRQNKMSHLVSLSFISSEETVSSTKQNHTR